MVITSPFSLCAQAERTDPQVQMTQNNAAAYFKYAAEQLLLSCFSVNHIRLGKILTIFVVVNSGRFLHNVTI